MVEMVDTSDLGSDAARHAGSIPARGTNPKGNYIKKVGK